VWILLPVISFVLAVAIFVIASYKGAKYNWGWFTTIKEATGKEIVINDNFVDFIPNRTGKFYNRTTHKMEPALNDEDQESFLTKHTGLYFIGWNPLRKVRQIPIHKRRLKTNLDQIPHIKDKIEIDANVTYVDHLRKWPLLMMDVDLADRTRIYLLIQGIYDVYDPYRMLEELKGEFFESLDGVMRAYILAKYGKLALPDMGTPAMDLKIEDLTGLYDVKSIVGLNPTSLVVVDWSLSDKDRELQEAAQQKRIQEERAAGRAAEGKGEAEYKRQVGNAEAEVEKAKDEARVAGDIKYLQELKTGNLSPHAARILALQQVPDLRMLVEAGAPTPVIVSAPTEDAPTRRAPRNAPAPVATPVGPSSTQPSQSNS
jgi:hypothetical protein